MALVLKPTAFRAWTRLCAEALSATRAEIDALNVFPVPDSDTGTNAYLTFAAGAEAVEALPGDTPLPELIRAYSDGLLMGAKGNCGVILSQLVRACFQNLPFESGIGPDDVARSFVAAADAAYASVGVPVEGTILSVARAAAIGAETAAATHDGSDEGRSVFTAASDAAREALERTPQQMEILAKAGVVDAGGRALVVVLDAAGQALTGRRPQPVTARLPVPIVAGDDLDPDGPSYEVMYLLDAADDQIGDLRATLGPLGDSLVVVGGDRLWNVHVHVDDVGAAIEAGIAAGRPYRIAVTHFADQIARRPRQGRIVVAATTGAGLAELCRASGAVALEFTRDSPLSTAQMAAAISGSGAEEVVVLPNNQRFVRQFEAAAQAARQDGIRVAVIPTQAQVQGLAALAVHDPGLGFDQVVVAMSSAAAYTQHGAVTIATEPGMTMAGPCQAGDVLGVIAGDFAVVGPDVASVAGQVLERILSPAAEMVTIVLGEGGDAAVEQQVQAYLRENRPDVDLVVYEGGQENYPLFLAVE
ncbi:MAG: DAK2 domain-containing protein [Aeromicrobium sp.]